MSRTTITAWVKCPFCGKRGYHTRKAAHTAMKEVARTAQVAPGTYNTYVCPDSGLYHWGHRPGCRTEGGVA